MAGFIDQLPLVALLFAVVFVLNVIPAFAPPTWMTLSFIGFSMPDVPVWGIALTGAIAATLGRVTLATLSRSIVRGKFLDAPTRANIDAIKDGLEKRQVFTFGMFLAYAFSPFPSNYLFIAYGLTTLRLALVAVPFFIGRLASYSFWVATGSALGDHLDMDTFESASYMGIYFIVSQLLLIPVIYAFTRIDWREAFEQKHLRWFRAI
jgi:hypothetical protein